MRKTINISVSESMFSLIHERGASEPYDSVSDYIRTLVRRDEFARLPTKRGPRPRRVNEIFMHRAEDVGEQ